MDNETKLWEPGPIVWAGIALVTAFTITAIISVVFDKIILQLI